MSARRDGVKSDHGGSDDELENWDDEAEKVNIPSIQFHLYFRFFNRFSLVLNLFALCRTQSVTMKPAIRLLMMMMMVMTVMAMLMEKERRGRRLFARFLRKW